jgi:hypothetical protein
MIVNPYKSLPTKAFWRSAVSEIPYADLKELWSPMDITLTDRIATAGSCFAQHIGRNLAERGANFMDCEPAPAAFFASGAEARRFGYGVYSCRYGNIYTARQLIQLFEEAFGRRKPRDIVWSSSGRFFDALRPSVDPVGQASERDVLMLRERHLEMVRKMFTSLDIFVFTMGLTEGWISKIDATMYPTAPGTLCGSFDADSHSFHNLGFQEIWSDMVAFWEGLHQVNSKARMLLTVSPVPLTATASGDHVLVASTYSKSVLRSIAGELAKNFDSIFYFPSYEVISSHPSRGMFYDPNLRSVNEMGVDYVMTHFFSGKLTSIFGKNTAHEKDKPSGLICDEEAQDR